MTEAQVDEQAKILLDYLQMHHKLRSCEAIFVFCSFDTRVAEHAAELFLEGLGDYMVFSGNGRGRITEQLFDKSEAETFANIARQVGVPDDKIIVEDQSTNTSENIRFTYNLLEERGLHPKSVLIVQKPSMERRAYATFKQQWPDKSTDVVVTSPPIPFDELGEAVGDKAYVIASIVGDVQRIKLYSEQGHQIPQDIPEEVWAAYERLVAAGYDRRLIREHTQH
jgi:uncharacterized SAM-binding protein YcdF (DUF218 family)